jgi:hypothetical protein
MRLAAFEPLSSADVLDYVRRAASHSSSAATVERAMIRERVLAGITRGEATLPPRFMLAMSRDGKVRRACTLAWQFSIVAGAKFDPSPKQQSPAGSAR